MRFTEELTRFDTKSKSSTRILQRYEQPIWRYLIYRAYHWYDMRVFNLPGFKKLEKWLWNRHDRKCQNDCGEGMVGRRGRPMKWESFCQYTPISCKQDLRCYALSIKKRTFISEEELP